MLRPKDIKRKPGAKRVWRAYVACNNGRPVYLTCKADTHTEAHEKLRQRHIEYLQGHVSAMVRLSGWAKKWLHTVNVKRHTLANYNILVDQHILPCLGDKKLQDISTSDVKMFTLQLSKELSPGYVNNCLMVLRAILRGAVDDGLLVRSPAAAVKKLQVNKTKIEAFTEEEVRDILEAAKDKHPAYYAPIWTAFHAGLRAGEIWGLRWDDIGPDCIKVRGTYSNGEFGHTKTKCERHVALPCAIPIDPAYHSKVKSKLVFSTSRGGPICQRNFRKNVWRRVLKDAEVKYRTFHTTRHTYASLHLRYGTSLEWIKEQLGHTSIEMTYGKYCHFLPKTDDGAAMRLARVIGE